MDNLDTSTWFKTITIKQWNTFIKCLNFLGSKEKKNMSSKHVINWAWPITTQVTLKNPATITIGRCAEKLSARTPSSKEWATTWSKPNARGQNMSSISIQTFWLNIFRKSKINFQGRKKNRGPTLVWVRPTDYCHITKAKMILPLSVIKIMLEEMQ